MKRSVRSMMFVAFALLILSSIVGPILVAQGLPNGTGDPAGAFGAAGPSDLLNGYYNASTNWISLLANTAQTLFWTLATIDLTWTCITLVLQHSDLQPWMAGFIRKILTIGFFAVLLQNGATWTTAIVNFFIGLGSTAGGRPVSGLSASGIMGNGVELAGQMLSGAASAAANTSTSPIGLLIGGVGSFAPTIILALGSLLIVIAYVIIALHFVMAMVEAYVVVGAGYIFLGFGGSRWTVPYTEKYMGMVVAAGVRIMVLELIIGLGSTLLPQWEATATKIAQVPDIFSGGSVGSTWSGVQAEFGLVASILIFALLCWTIPQIAANVASGGLSMSGGDALGAASAAGTAAFAGASYGSNSSPSGAGSAETVQQIAQAAAMRGAELGVAAATGGSGAAAMGATEAAGAAGGLSGSEAAAAALTPEPPPMGGSESGADSASAQVLPPDDGPGEASPNEAVGPGGDSSDAASQTATSGSSSLAAAEGENAKNVTAMGAELQAIETARQGGADVAEAFQAGSDAKAEALSNFDMSGQNAPSSTSSDSGGAATDASNDAKAEASAAQADRATDRDATKANEAPGIDQGQVSSEDAVRNAGNTARMEALAKGASPQQAIQAEREARGKARSGLSRAKQVIGGLDTALNKMPDDGGRMGGSTPRMGHGDE